MLHPSVTITPFQSGTGYLYVRVEIFAVALNDVVSFEFQVCGPNDTPESVALKWLTANNYANLNYWLAADQSTLDRGAALVAEIYRDAAIYGHCD